MTRPAASLERSLKRSREAAARLHEQLGDVYDGAFVDTATTDSVAVLVDGLCPRPWWFRLLRRTGLAG